MEEREAIQWLFKVWGLNGTSMFTANMFLNTSWLLGDNSRGDYDLATKHTIEFCMGLKPFNKLL